MNITQRVVNAYTAFAGLNKTENSVGNEADQFLRYGSRHKPLLQDWSQVEMSDQDMYTGYSYAAIKKRANRASVLGKRFLYTEAAPKVMDAAKVKDEELKHPYLDLIKKSKEFSQRRFWHDISTYLDLEGVYYLMAVRAIADNPDGTKRIGAVQKFVMLNPYQVHRVLRQSDGTVGGYVENRNGMYREIPKEMIIEIRLLNPFDNDVPFSMTDAAKESQFTMKQAGDYTRHSIKGNINAPGAITTDVILEDQIFDNFVSRIKNHDKGEPIYGNGAGAINWQSMQIDLDKAALDKINEIHRSVLFSVSGVSKTSMGIEESGTGREVSKTQKDDFTENAVMPQIEDIIDALNLDYRQWYPEWEQNEYEILLDNPLESDRDAELKDIDIRTKEYELTNKLQSMGYEYEIAARYAHGDISLEELGEPTLEEELSDAEAEEIAAREMGIETIDSEPEPGNEIDELDTSDRVKASVVGNRLEDESVVYNRFVKPEDNAKKLKEAAKRVKQKLKAQRESARLQKIAEREAKKAELAKKAETKKEEKPTEVTPKPENVPDEPKPNVIVEVKAANTVDERMKAVNQIAARDFPDLYDGLNIDMNNLGCIMIDTEKIPVLQFVKNPDADLYRDTNYDQSPVPGENQAHVTLLFGLLENGNIWKDKVNQLLVGWKLETVTIQEVSYFDLGDSYAIIGLVEKTPELVDGHERLTLLPHINTFSEYHPHITLAYIKHDEALLEKWITPLAKKYNGQKVATKGINYGDLPEDVAADNSNEAKQAVLTPVDTPTSHDCAEHGLVTNSTLETAKNALNPELKDDVILQEANLQNAVARLEQDVLNAVLDALRNGDINKAERIISEAQEETITGELVITLAAFYTVLFPIYAAQLMAARLAEFGTQGIFAMSNEVIAAIDNASKKAAESHMQTIIKDLTKAYDNAVDEVAKTELVETVLREVQQQNPQYTEKLPENPNAEDVVKAVERGKFDSDPAYELARKMALEGAGLVVVEKALKDAYANMTTTRAKTIARHEASRVFNMSQFQADMQFLTESGYINNAYKVLRSRTGDPCAVCASLIEATRANPVPFAKNFADLGEELTASYRKENGKMAVQKVAVNYEPISSGNIHVNCNCEYELIVKAEDGTILNDLRFKVENAKGDKYNPYRDSRTGRFEDGLTIIELERMLKKGGNQEKIERAKKKLAEMAKKYPGRKYGEKFEAYAERYIQENPQKAAEDYMAQVKKEFRSPIANIVAADEAKKIIPGFEAARSADYHEPASGFVKAYYKSLLNNESSKHLPVIFTAGGTGAGKSTALNGKLDNYADYAVVYDGNMAGFDSAKSKIDAALATGRKVEIAFVDRDPVIAFKYGVIPRTATEGRTITIKDHIQTHLDSRDVVVRMAEEYKDNFNVQIHIYDNNGGIGDSHEVPLANVSKNVYNKDKLQKELENEAKIARDNGQISEEVYGLITNQTADTVSEQSDNGESKSEQSGSKQSTKEQVRYPAGSPGPLEYDKSALEDIKDFKAAAKVDNLTDEERDAVDAYTDVGHATLNAALRFNRRSDNEKYIPALDSALEKSTLKQNVMLWRGAEFDDPAIVQKIIESGSFTDKGYFSTSLDKEVAVKDFTGGSGANVLFMLEAEEGDNGIYVDSNLDNKKNEEEVLLPRGREWFVYDSWVKTINGKEVTVIGLE